MQFKEKFNQWIEAFKKAELREMTDQETSIFIDGFQIESRGNVKIDWSNLGEDDPYPLHILGRRVTAIGLNITTVAGLFIALLSSSPGELVMYAHFLKAEQVRRNGQKITIEVLGKEIFPNGFPTKESLQSLWDMQKTPDGRNMLDFMDDASTRSALA